MAYNFENITTGALPVCAMLIGGKWVAGEGCVTEVLDKYRLVPVAQLPGSSPSQISAMIDAAQAAFDADCLTLFDRGRVLDGVADCIKARQAEFVEVMQIETGFTTSDCNGEIGRTVQTMRLAAEEARRLAGHVLPVSGAPGQGRRVAVTLQVPLGVVLAVTPFNAPLNTVAHKLAPAIGAGNTVILKPASQTPRTACLLADCFLEAGLPEGYLQVFHGGGEAVGHAMADQRVRYIAFTGSTEVGRIIQAKAGLRRTQMELGSIAFTVLTEDADLDAALPKVVAAGYRKAGQVCTSVQVLLAHDSIKTEVEARMAEQVATLKHGNPTSDGCVTGAMISLADAERVEGWIGEAQAAGARLLAGGTRKDAVLAPTLMADIGPGMSLGCQEVFGPVIGIEGFSEIEDALDRVNSTPYGLATGIFTNRMDWAFAAARRLRVGGVHVNETSSARLDMMPYGGSKDSGFGREGPHYAMREMSEERVVSFSV